MIKFKYPSHIQVLLYEYLKIFDPSTIKEYNSFFNQTKFCLWPYDFETIVTSPFEALFHLSKATFSQKEQEHIKSFMSYDYYQAEIARFFMEHKNELNISTCYYCNMDYIFVYNDYYKSPFDFVKNASNKELDNIKGIGPSTIKKVLDEREKINSIDDLSIPPGKKDLLKNADWTKKKYNQFTLDHVIDKGTHPLFSLSFFNLLPSCYVCNSKLKHTRTLIKKDATVSPTHEEFSFDKDALFNIVFLNSKGMEDIRNKDDFELSLYTEKKYEWYSQVFKLNGRYQFHKDEIVDIINKTAKYPESQISQIARIVGRDTESVRKDIFGKELFVGPLEDKPLTKFKRDIARKLGVKSIADTEL